LKLTGREHCSRLRGREAPDAKGIDRQRAAAVAHELRDHAADHRRKFEAKPWGEEILRLALAGAGEREIEARLEIEPPTLSVTADPELLAQAVLNLLRNAVRVTAEVTDAVVVLSIRRDRNGNFHIEVRDNGPGIDPDRREDIFLPFYTTHKGGSGVGLSFARQVALAHGGSIAALDSPEGGATLQMIV